MRPKIFYIAIDDCQTGGEISTYNHVDALNASGFNAYAVHIREGHRHTWFANNTRVISLRTLHEIYDKDLDYIVPPETRVCHAVMSFPGKKVIFNKSLWHGFNQFRLDANSRYPYLSEETVAVVAGSDHNVNQLKCAFPSVQIFRVYPQIDCDLFVYREVFLKKKRIVCVMKAVDSLCVLYHMLLARAAAGLNSVHEYEWIFLQGYSYEQVAELLRDTLILISLNTAEGFGRIVIEAMACGSLVIGCGTGPLKETLPPEARFESDDFVKMVAQIEAITNTFPSDADRWNQWSAAGRKIAESFTAERQRTDLVKMWEQIIFKE